MATNILGQKLRTLRERAGKSMAALALETGVSRAYIHVLESRRRDWLERVIENGEAAQPSRDLIIRVAFALGLDLDGCDDLLLTAGYAPLFPLPRRSDRQL